MRDADAASVVLPVMFVGGTVAVLAAMRPRNIAANVAAGRSSTEPPGGTDGGGGQGSMEGSGARSVWVWPLPRWNGYAPTISSGFGARTDAKGQQVKHLGVDIMYARRDRADQRDRYPPRTKHGSPNHFMPDATPVLAATDAKVWSAGMTPRGYTVVLDHGPPWASYYTHLAEMFVQPTQRGQSGQRVRAGDIIGHVGADPLDGEGLMHLHFELWYRGARESAIDPEPLMATWLVAPASLSLVAST